METGKKGNPAKSNVSLVDILKRILLFVAIVAVTTVMLRPVQLALHDRMEKIRDGFLNQFEEYSGLILRYGSMGPSIFGVLDLRNVIVLREDESELVSVSRLRLSYSIIGFLKGQTVQAFHSARIDRPVLSLDFEKDSTLIQRLNLNANDADANDVFAGNWLPSNFTCRILNGEWDLTGTAGNLRLQGLRIEAVVRQNRLSFQGRLEALATPNKNKIFIDTNAAMRARINGEYRMDLSEGSASIQIPSLSGKNFRFRPMSIGVYLSHGVFELRKTYDRLPVAISVIYDTAAGTIKGSLEAENFSFIELVNLSGSWAEYNHFLETRISGNAGLDLDKHGELKYSINAGTRGPLTNAIYLDLAAHGNRSEVTINNLEIKAPGGSLDFSGGARFLQGELIPLAPEGFLSLSSFSLRSPDNFNYDDGISGSITIYSQDKMIGLFGENISAGKTELSDLNASLHSDDYGLSFIFTVRKPENEYDTRILSLEGSVDYDPALKIIDHIRASLLLDSFLAGDILAFTEPLLPSALLPPLIQTPLMRGAADNLSISTEVFFTTDNEHLLYNAPNITFNFGSLVNIRAEASFSGTNRNFELNRGIVDWNNAQIGFSCFVDYSDPRDINFSINTSYKEANYFFEGMILNQLNISIRGSHGFMVNLSTGDNNNFSGYAMAELLPIPSGDRFAYLSFLSFFNYDSPSKWQARIDKMELRGISTPSSTASISFTGVATETGLTLPDVLIEDLRGNLDGTIGLIWDPSFSFCNFSLDLTGSSRYEYYGIYGSYRDKILDFHFSGQGMQFSRFSGYNAIANLNLALLWESSSDFGLEAELSSFILFRENNTLRASTAFILNADLFKINHLSADLGNLNFHIPLFEINRPKSFGEAEAVLLGTLSGMPMELAFRGEVAFSSTDTWFDLFSDGAFLNSKLTVNSARYNNILATEPFAFAVNAIRENSGSTVNVSGGPRNMLRLNYRADQEGDNIFFAALSAPSPVRGSFSGIISSGDIDAQINDLYVDMESLWRFIPPSVKDVKFPGGIVTGAVRVTGPLDDPDFFGTCYAKSIQIIVPEFITQPIRPVPTVFELTGNEMTFGPIDAAVARGGGKANGWFRFENWIPNTFIIDIHVPHETPIPYGFDLSGFLANGLASGNLSIALEDFILSVTGDLTAHNTVIGLGAMDFTATPFEAMFDVENKTIKLAVDLSIKSGRRVEFYWPSSDFPVLQATADMGTGINVNFDETSTSLSIVGDVKLRSGEIFYLDRNFYLREGTLFFNEDELNFDPRITARAEIRDQSDTGPVTIAMIMENAPLMSFSPRFESNPPLSQFEIYSLLGQYPQGDSDSGQRNVFVAGIDFLSQSFLFRRFQRQVRDLLGLDMFSVRTTIFHNLITQTPGNRPQENTERPVRFGNYFDNSTVFIGKFFGADIFGEALLSFRYDEDKQTMGGLKLEPEISLEMRNPLFDIRFNMALLHPETWFLEDISFSFIWRRSF